MRGSILWNRHTQARVSEPTVSTWEQLNVGNRGSINRITEARYCSVYQFLDQAVWNRHTQARVSEPTVSTWERFTVGNRGSVNRITEARYCSVYRFLDSTR
jgi:hypothetical protein